MEARTRALLGMAGLVAAIMLGVVLIEGSDDDESRTVTTEPGEDAVAGEKTSTATRPKGTQPAPVANGPYTPAPGSDEEEVFKTVDGTYEALEPGRDAKRAKGRICDVSCNKAIHRIDKKRFCDLMTEEAQAETKEYGFEISDSADVKTCEDGLHMILRRSVQISGSLADTLDFEIVGIEVEGEEATASIKRGKTVSSMALVKEDGEWKVPATPGWNQDQGN